MSKLKLEKKHELILLRLRYLKRELDFVKQTYELAAEEFLEEYKRKVMSLPEIQRDKIREAINNQKLKKVKKSIQKEQEEASKPSPPKEAEEKQSERQPNTKERQAKKLFKEVAKASHPDTVMDSSEEERVRKEKLFKKAQEAMKDSKYFELIEVAEMLGIEIPPPTKEGVQLLKESVSIINKEIGRHKQSYAWIWYHSPNNKVRIMSKYIAEVVNGRIRT